MRTESLAFYSRLSSSIDFAIVLAFTRELASFPSHTNIMYLNEQFSLNSDVLVVLSPLRMNDSSEWLAERNSSDSLLETMLERLSEVS